MSFYDENFRKGNDSRRQGPAPEPTPLSSPYLDPDNVDPLADTVQYSPPPPPSPSWPPVGGGNGSGKQRHWRWEYIGAVALVLLVLVGFLLWHQSHTTTPIPHPTPTFSVLSTPSPTATTIATATTAPVLTCPAAPTTARGTISNLAAFFTIPGVPTGSVAYYNASEIGETNHIQSLVLHACSPASATQITQAYANALSGWTTCGAQCYQTTFTYNGVTLIKSVQVQAAQANGGVTNYQLALTLNAAITKTSLPVAAQANIGFVSAAQQDATWLGNGQLQLAPNTFAASSSACATTATYAQLHQLAYSGVTSPISISHDPNQPTIGCLRALVTYDVLLNASSLPSSRNCIVTSK